ncbi:MAG: lysophospholipid acyltransferase family protein [Desulfatirhabdiaceae bacterium]
MPLNTNALIRSPIVLNGFYGLVMLLCRTYRYTAVNESQWLNHYAAGGRILFCAWHQQFFTALHYFQKFRPARFALMISQSKDGDIAAVLAEKGGWNPVRGSSSKGGKSALRQMIAEIRRLRLGGHIVDGPQGPAGIVKPGAIALAFAAKAVIVPIYFSANRAWYMKSWDRFMIPKPFARVALIYGESMIVHDTEKTQLEFLREKLEMAMRPHLID